MIEGFTFPREVTDAEVEALLRDGDVVDAGADPASERPLAAALGLLALAIGVPLVRARAAR